MSDKISISLATLERHNHIVGGIERWIKLYEQDNAEFAKDANLRYIANWNACK